MDNTATAVFISIGGVINAKSVLKQWKMLRAVAVFIQVYK